ncbi:MAG: endolytic transglycosylase MltG [Gammaproteobacteria bacterium]
MKRWQRWLVAAGSGMLLGLMGLAAVIFAEVEQAMRVPPALSGSALLQIEPGSSISRIARQIEANGWVADYRLLLLHTRLTRTAQHLQAGTYEMLPGDTLRDLLQRIAGGRTKVFTVRFIEGSRFADMRRILAAQPYIEQSLDQLSDAEIVRELDLDAPSPEGLFFPSTYHYEAGTSDLELLRRAARRLQEVLDEAWRERQAELPFEGPYEGLILASIVEKETGLDTERAEVAGVFVRRLRLGMKLQTDPTVLYGRDAAIEGPLTRADLVREHPYNTYVHAGLPPTPIAMPGRDAIVAALNPAPGKTLYFVATGTGGHHFSTSLREHNEAVRRYQRSRGQ